MNGSRFVWFALFLLACGTATPPPQQSETTPSLPTYTPRAAATEEARAAKPPPLPAGTGPTGAGVPAPGSVRAPQTGPAAPSAIQAAGTAGDADPTAGLPPPSGAPPASCDAPPAPIVIRPIELPKSGTYECRFNTGETTKGADTGSDRAGFAVLIGSAAATPEGAVAHYDEAGKLLRFADERGAHVFSYEGTRVLAYERSSKAWSMKSVYQYDPRGYLLRVASRDSNGRQYTIAIEYGDDCLPSRVQDSQNGRGYSYQYTKSPLRLKALGVHSAHQNLTYAAEYDRKDRITKLAVDQYVFDTYGYDRAGRLNASVVQQETRCNVHYGDDESLDSGSCSDYGGSAEIGFKGECPVELCQAPPTIGSTLPRLCMYGGRRVELTMWPQHPVNGP